MVKLYNRVKMTVTGAPGLGSFVLSGAVSGHTTFAAQVSNGAKVTYLAEQGSLFETGVGTYSASSNSLTRDTVEITSGGNTTKLTFGASVQVSIAATAGALPHDGLVDASTYSEANDRLIGLQGGSLKRIKPTLEYVSKSTATAQTIASSLAAPYFLPTYRALKIDEFLTSDLSTVDQRAQVEAAIAVWGGSTKYTSLDLCGRRIGISGSIKPTGTLVVSGNGERWFTNGLLTALTDQTPFATVTKTSVTVVAQGDTLTMASTTSINVGDHISGAGIPRETYVLSTTATTVTMSKIAYSGSTVSITFTNFVCMLDFSNFTSFTNVSFRDLTLDCQGFISGMRLPLNVSGKIKWERCRFRGVTGRGIVTPQLVTCIYDQVYGNSNEVSVAPASRTSIFCTPGGDSKMRQCGIEFFLHTVVTQSALLYSGNHNFQGHDTDLTRTAQLVLQGKSGDVVVTANRIDNSYIEITDEADSGGGSPLGWVIITGNEGVVSPKNDANIPNFAFVVVRPFAKARVLRNLIVENNLFLDVSSNSTMDYFWRVDTTNGALSTVTGPTRISFRNNILRNVNFETKTRPTLSVTKAPASAATVWTFDYTNLFPFSMGVARVISVVPVNLTNSSSVAQYDNPNITVSGNIVTLTFAAARAGTIYVTVDCSPDDV